MQIYTMLFLSLHGSMVWTYGVSPSPLNSKRVQTIESKIPRLISRAPVYFSDCSIDSDLPIPFVRNLSITNSSVTPYLTVLILWFSIYPRSLSIPDNPPHSGPTMIKFCKWSYASNSHSYLLAPNILHT